MTAIFMHEATTCEIHTGKPGKGKNPEPANCPACTRCGYSKCSTPWLRWNDNTQTHIECELKVARKLEAIKYVEGDQFRVVREGARLEGFLLHGEELISGWSRRLQVGEVLTCKGWQVINVGELEIRGTQWTGAKIPESAVSIQVWPFDGLFRPFPMEGVLEPYVEDSGEDLQAVIDQIEEGHVVDLTTYLADTSHLVEAPNDDEVVDLSGY
jgi:hypothetical protein